MRKNIDYIENKIKIKKKKKKKKKKKILPINPFGV